MLCSSDRSSSTSLTSKIMSVGLSRIVIGKENNPIALANKKNNILDGRNNPIALTNQIKIVLSVFLMNQRLKIQLP